MKTFFLDTSKLGDPAFALLVKRGFKVATDRLVNGLLDRRFEQVIVDEENADLSITVDIPDDFFGDMKQRQKRELPPYTMLTLRALSSELDELFNQFPVFQSFADSMTEEETFEHVIAFLPELQEAYRVIVPVMIRDLRAILAGEMPAYNQQINHARDHGASMRSALDIEEGHFSFEFEITEEDRHLEFTSTITKVTGGFHYSFMLKTPEGERTLTGSYSSRPMASARLVVDTSQAA